MNKLKWNQTSTREWILVVFIFVLLIQLGLNVYNTSNTIDLYQDRYDENQKTIVKYANLIDVYMIKERYFSDPPRRINYIPPRMDYFLFEKESLDEND